MLLLVLVVNKLLGMVVGNSKSGPDGLHLCHS